ncbi:MAG: hypothetical protein LBP95_03535, partial [Deltaproteobacteria bacterium]|nr:hypothetical protein [Deltaproteobacteria bacterium]
FMMPSSSSRSSWERNILYIVAMATSSGSSCHDYTPFCRRNQRYKVLDLISFNSAYPILSDDDQFINFFTNVKIYRFAPQLIFYFCNIVFQAIKDKARPYVSRFHWKEQNLLFMRVLFGLGVEAMT